MKEIIDEFKMLATHKDMWQVYKEFLELSAIAYSNICDKAQAKDREERYLEIIKTYKSGQADHIAKILALIVLEMEKDPQDILGKIFMELRLGSSWTGQVFTPQNLADMLAELSFKEDEIKERGYITVMEPAVGGGVTIIGLAKVMLKKGCNPQKQLLAICGDIDIKAVHMTYIQLSMLGIPAIVRHQDTLTQEIMSTWYTPNYILDLWRYKND
ncbi:N-6 DNA methylase [Peptoniphilus hominis (ex Hitch et al. 2025)]|uniref:N-6 DNA methylase n=1 Tax=Peptoniphilus hominis (ex Hitch et al. 2025) TaxID=3133174 RepID=A0ABV1CBE4_9FIRM